MDNIVYQIKTANMTAYTKNIVTCDEICARCIDSGEMPKVRRMKRNQVPICDLELVNELK